MVIYEFNLLFYKRKSKFFPKTPGLTFLTHPLPTPSLLRWARGSDPPLSPIPSTRRPFSPLPGSLGRFSFLSSLLIRFRPNSPAVLFLFLSVVLACPTGPSACWTSQAPSL